MRYGIFIGFLVLFSVGLSAETVLKRQKQLRQYKNALIPVHQHMTETLKSNWMTRFPYENGQLFEDQNRHGLFHGEPYLYSKKRVKLGIWETTLYLQPLGGFSQAQQNILFTAKQFYNIYFRFRVIILPALEVAQIPKSPSGQLDVDFINNQVLATLKKKYRDSVAVIGITAYDIATLDSYTRTYNFLFAKASQKFRTNTWSLYRLGNPDLDRQSYQLTLKNALRLAVHELGHNLGYSHCRAYRCSMNGYLSFNDIKAGPIYTCPECSAKIWWVTLYNPLNRLKRLVSFGQNHYLTQETNIWQKSLNVLWPISRMFHPTKTLVQTPPKKTPTPAEGSKLPSNPETIIKTGSQERNLTEVPVRLPKNPEVIIKLPSKPKPKAKPKIKKASKPKTKVKSKKRSKSKAKSKAKKQAKSKKKKPARATTSKSPKKTKRKKAAVIQHR